MKSKEALERIKREPPEYTSTLYDLDMWEEDISTIEKALNDFEELKDPYDEYESEDGMYFITRRTYWNTYLDEINYGYTIYKWNGNIKLIGTHVKGMKPIEVKDRDEIFHAGTVRKKTDCKEFLENALETIKMTRDYIKKGKKK